MRHYCHIRHSHASEIAMASSSINLVFRVRDFSSATIHMLSLDMLCTRFFRLQHFSNQAKKKKKKYRNHKIIVDFQVILSLRN